MRKIWLLLLLSLSFACVSLAEDNVQIGKNSPWSLNLPDAWGLRRNDDSLILRKGDCIVEFSLLSFGSEDATGYLLYRRQHQDMTFSEISRTDTPQYKIYYQTVVPTEGKGSIELVVSNENSSVLVRALGFEPKDVSPILWIVKRLNVVK